MKKRITALLLALLTILALPGCGVRAQELTMGMNAIMLMNKGYGYWNDKDTMLPGYLTVVLTSVVIPVICCLLCGIIGLSPML